jgi:hypothetical protein
VKKKNEAKHGAHSAPLIAGEHLAKRDALRRLNYDVHGQAS